MNYLIGEERYSDAEIDRIINVFANAYFAMQEANAMMLRELDKLLQVRGKAFRFSEKQKHGKIMKLLATLKPLIGDLFDDSPSVFGGNAEKYDMYRSDAADVARIVSYLYDRTEGEIRKSQMIEEFISAMPERTRGIDKIIGNMKIR